MSERELREGTVLGARYEIVRALGRGGLGAVYEARDPVLKRRVAIKVLRDLSASEKDLARFAQEAELCARIVHPNVVPLFGYTPRREEPAPGEPAFIVMDLVEGTSLAHRLAAGPLSLREAVVVTEQLLSALAAAHDLGVIHRDVKPANVILRANTKDIEALLVDFGIATLSDGSARVQTTTGVALGTPGYAAPEQMRAMPLDARTDLYAVGGCLHRMLTGELAWKPQEVLRQLSGDRSTRASKLRPDVPPWLDEVIAKALAADPDQRYASADEMLAALRAADGDTARTDEATTRPAPAAPREKSARTGLLAAGATILAGGAIAGGAFALGLLPSKPSETTDASAASDVGAPVASTVSPEAAPIASAALVAPEREDASSIDATTTSTATTVAPSRPAPPAGRCVCAARKGALCKQPQASRCGCNPGNNNYLCFAIDPRDRTRCAKSFAPGTQGAPCRGSKRSRSGEYVTELSAGTFDACSSCYADYAEKRVYRGATGDACRGYGEDGTAADGRLECDP